MSMLLFQFLMRNILQKHAHYLYATKIYIILLGYRMDRVELYWVYIIYCC